MSMLKIIQEATSENPSGIKESLEEELKKRVLVALESNDDDDDDLDEARRKGPPKVRTSAYDGPDQGPGDYEVNVKGHGFARVTGRSTKDAITKALRSLKVGSNREEAARKAKVKKIG